MNGGKIVRSGNPSLRENTFNDYQGLGYQNEMTISGTVNKTFILLVLVTASAAFTWYLYFTGQNVMPYLITGAIGSFIFALITIFAKKAAPVTAPIYAILEGLFIGGISAFYEEQVEGITFMAVSLTFAVLFGLLLVYKSGLIKVTQNFRLGIFAATLGIFLAYFLHFILSFFGMSIPFIHDSGPIGIGVSVFIVIIAALNLVLDFDFIEKGAEMRCPKYLEWYAAFGLMVTLVWLYLEILRLLSKIFSRD
ncbi:Bax inhibitor-1/YccA family protein [Bacillus kwashiorkori]|uniref:Bax inhibitor-1/YccA family protein n=1 Tax=Bacillus kwashiorkori TaxID=1522318 RepID=UPI00078474FB